MQPSATRRPWSGWTWAGWPALEVDERGGRRGARARGRLPPPPPPPPAPDPRRDWRLRQDIPHNAFYAPNQIRHLIRWEAAVGVPTLPPAWARDPGRPWRLNEITVFTHMKPPPRPTYTSVSRAAPGPGPGAGAGAGAVGDGPEWWEGAARGLPLGAVLLAALLLLVRAADKCLHTNLFKLPLRRRQSDEWPTPSVMATNLSVRVAGEADPPPPYAAAAGPKAAEEPPPPYSACYVTYSNPAGRGPTVRLFPSSLRYGYEEGRSGLLDDEPPPPPPPPPPPRAPTHDDPPPAFESSDHLRIDDGGAGVVQRIDAAGPDLNYDPIPADDIPAVHSVFPPRDGADSRDLSTNADLDSVVVIKKQRDDFLAV